MKKIIIMIGFIILTAFITIGIWAHPWTLPLKYVDEESLGLKRVLTISSDEPVESIPQFISDVSEELISVVNNLLPKKSVDDTAQSDMPTKVISVNNDQEDNEDLTINTVIEDSLLLSEIRKNIARTKESWDLYKILSLHRETIHRLSEAEKDSTNSIKKKGFVVR